MPKCIKLTEEYIDDIVDWGRSKGLNLDYIRDNMEFNAEDGEDTYLVLDGDQWKKNLTVTDLTGSGFHAVWKITDGEMDGHFNEIERI